MQYASFLLRNQCNCVSLFSIFSWVENSKQNSVVIDILLHESNSTLVKFLDYSMLTDFSMYYIHHYSSYFPLSLCLNSQVLDCQIADGMTLQVHTVNLLLETHGGARRQGGASW